MEENKYIEMIVELKDGDFNFNSFEETFIDSIEDIVNDPSGFLTERQIETLGNIYEKYCE